jgi:hypothetical protein
MKCSSCIRTASKYTSILDQVVDTTVIVVDDVTQLVYEYYVLEYTLSHDIPFESVMLYSRINTGLYREKLSAKHAYHYY